MIALFVALAVPLLGASDASVVIDVTVNNHGGDCDAGDSPTMSPVKPVVPDYSPLYPFGNSPTRSPVKPVGSPTKSPVKPVGSPTGYPTYSPLYPYAKNGGWHEADCLACVALHCHSCLSKCMHVTDGKCFYCMEKIKGSDNRSCGQNHCQQECGYPDQHISFEECMGAKLTDKQAPYCFAPGDYSDWYNKHAGSGSKPQNPPTCAQKLGDDWEKMLFMDNRGRINYGKFKDIWAPMTGKAADKYQECGPSSLKYGQCPNSLKKKKTYKKNDWPAHADVSCTFCAC